jgi:hypothetical protein
LAVCVFQATWREESEASDGAPIDRAAGLNLDWSIFFWIDPPKVKPMFELVILSVICFAAAYAAFLWREGRRDDVLFGAFVEKRSADQVKKAR